MESVSNRCYGELRPQRSTARAAIQQLHCHYKDFLRPLGITEGTGPLIRFISGWPPDLTPFSGRCVAMAMARVRATMFNLRFREDLPENSLRRAEGRRLKDLRAG